MIFDRVIVSMFGTNCYILADDAGEGVLIDPGGDWDAIASKIQDLGVHINAIVLTHGHMDHIGALKTARKELGVPLYYHQADRGLIGPKADKYLEEGDEIPVGELCLKVFHTPGHTPGGICLLETTTKSILFTGDTLFKESIGRTDIGGSMPDLMKSIRQKIMDNDEIPDECLIVPGHMGTSTKQYERTHNIFRHDWERVNID
jgi:glyoxylase-like metal-dependent hydrolase (beta-lactamase superfamily II)